MAKKIDRSRIEAGRFALPKKLAFLLEDKVDFLSVADKDGDWTVEVQAGALQKLVRSKAQLKALKAEHKLATGGHADALAAAEAEHGGTRAALAKAEQRIRALEKKLAAATVAAAAPSADAKVGKPARSARAVKPVKAVPSVTYPHADAQPAAEVDAPAEKSPDALPEVAPAAPSTPADSAEAAKLQDDAGSASQAG